MYLWIYIYFVRQFDGVKKKYITELRIICKKLFHMLNANLEM